MNMVRRNKYGAKAIVIDGIRFPSLAEGRRYSELKLLERAGKISSLQLHPRFQISLNGKRICIVELDSSYWDYDAGRDRYEDVKGKDTALSKLKRALVEAQYGFKVELIRC